MLNLFRDTPIEPPTPFEQDINNLVERLKAEVRDIYRQYQLSPYAGWWIYGNNQQNQEMLLFKQFADLIVKKYSHNLTVTEPNNLVVEIAKWINDIRLVSQRENLNEVISEIESLKVRVADFKERTHL